LEQNWSVVVTIASASQNDGKRLENLFLLSFGHRDPLAATISSYGWRVSSARRSKDLRNRFLASNALVAVIDMRDETTSALSAIEEVAMIAKAGGIAILALGDLSSCPDIAELSYTAGATHFGDISNPNYGLKPAINFAYRYVEHMRGGIEATQSFNQLLAATDQQWSFSKTDSSVNQVSKSLQLKLPMVDFSNYPATGIYRQLTQEERLRVRGAMGRLRDGSAQAAVPHILAGEKVVHHLHDDGEVIFGRIENFGQSHKRDNWVDRDLLSGLRNAASARSWIKSKRAESEHGGVVILGLRNFRHHQRGLWAIDW